LTADECRINKNALIQTVFWPFFPLGFSFVTTIMVEDVCVL